MHLLSWAPTSQLSYLNISPSTGKLGRRRNLPVISFLPRPLIHGNFVIYGDLLRCDRICSRDPTPSPRPRTSPPPRRLPAPKYDVERSRIQFSHLTRPQPHCTVSTLSDIASIVLPLPLEASNEAPLTRASPIEALPSESQRHPTLTPLSRSTSSGLFHDLHLGSYSKFHAAIPLPCIGSLFPPSF